jgi:NADPH-dependent curcumin reductase CurA
MSNKQILVKELPQGQLQEKHFEMHEAAQPEPAPGEVLTRTVLLSLDPANRAWMQGATYRAPVLPGEVMSGYALAEVVESKDPRFQAGQIVECENGWQEYACQPADALIPVQPRTALPHHLSVLGLTGLTAYFGLLDIGQPRPGETVLVSAAAGATGSVAGQIARIAGCRVVGIAGSDEKCAWLTDELGFHASINYKTQKVSRAIKETCPAGVDVFFDNTGGDILDATLFRMNQGGRVVCCGAVSQYDTDNPAPGPRGVPGLIITKRLRMEGFIVMDYFHQRKAAEEKLATWLEAGNLVAREDILEGLERAPQGLIGLLGGENIGKRMVRVAPDPA